MIAARDLPVVPAEDGSRRWRRLVVLAMGALAVGGVLRLVFPEDIVYAGDESWTFEHVRDALAGGPLPTIGMPSSRGIKNAGMSVWVFYGLGLVLGVKTPEGLARAVAILAIVAHALLLCIPLVLLRGKQPREREAWLWAIVLVSTNPILVYLERKIWAQSVLPIFMVGLWCGWLRRETRTFAFLWGVFGALVGQVHMAGLFLSPALAAWTKLADRTGKKPRWGYWLGGSVVGGLPAIPWLLYLLRDRPGASGAPWWHRLRLEFYQYFVSDPSGLCSEYFLGPDTWSSMRHPLVGGHPTYLVAFGHVVLAVASLAIVVGVLRDLVERRPTVRSVVFGAETETGVLLAATLIGMGALMTLPGIAIHRHYMMAAFPLPYVFTALLALRRPNGRRWLVALFAGGLVVSAGQLSFVHATGAFRPDRGTAIQSH